MKNDPIDTQNRRAMVLHVAALEKAIDDEAFTIDGIDDGFRQAEEFARTIDYAAPKSKLAAHLAEARDTTFIAIERAEEWSRIEKRFAADRIGRALDPITLGRLIALTIRKEDRERRSEARWAREISGAMAGKRDFNPLKITVFNP